MNYRSRTQDIHLCIFRLYLQHVEARRYPEDEETPVERGTGDVDEQTYGVR